MTDKEAINILKDMIDYQWGFSDMEKSIGIEALEEAIEALENQKSVIEELEKLKVEFEEDKYILLNQATAIKVIDNRITQLKGE